MSFLQERSIETGLPTNAYDGTEQRKRVRASGFERYFDTIVVSGEVEYCEPSPEIYYDMLNRRELDSRHVICAGDSGKYDIHGAKKVEMRSVLLRHNQWLSIKIGRSHLTWYE